MKTSIVFRRTVLAVVLPAAVMALSQTSYPRAFWDIASPHAITRWLVWVILAGLAVLEWRYLGALMLLVHARGRVAILARLLTDPADLLRRRRWKFRLAAAGLSTLAAFGLAELVFRVLDIRPVAPPSAPARMVDNSRNALGIREDWDVIPDDDPRLRVAFLGDSFVYGDNVEPHETFCHLVEALLSPDWPTGVVTINLGEPATNPGTQLPIYTRLRDKLHPDVVVQVVYLNDLGVNLQRLLMTMYRLRQERLSVGTWSRVMTYAETQIRYWQIWKDTFGYYRGGTTTQQRVESWKKFTSDIRACRAAVEQSEAVYALVMFPWLHNLDKYELRDVHDKMGTFASELGVPYLDLLDVFEGLDGEKLRIGGDDDHPSEAGHRVAAERLTRFLREEVLPQQEGASGTHPTRLLRGRRANAGDTLRDDD